MSKQVGIKITGLSQTLQAIKAFEPEVYKAMRKRIRTRLRAVGSGAAGRYGGKYKVSLRDSARRAGGSVISVMGPQSGPNDWTSPQTRAVIFEFAQNGRTPQAQAAIDSFQSRYGAPGRFLWEEWDSQGGDGIVDEVTAEIRDAERTLQRNLDAAGVGY